MKEGRNEGRNEVESEGGREGVTEGEREASFMNAHIPMYFFYFFLHSIGGLLPDPVALRDDGRERGEGGREGGREGSGR